jgi:N4-gp56 family major capsid protein
MASQIWTTGSLGGFFYSNQLSNELRVALQPQCKFRQFAEVYAAFGKGKGETFTWDIAGNVVTQGRTLTETSTVPQTNITITQGTGTVTEGGNKVNYTKKLETLAQIGPRRVFVQALRNDAKKFFDILAWTQLNRTPLRIGSSTTTSIALSTGGTCTTTNSNAMGKTHVKLIIDAMKERNIGPYVDDDYYAIGWTSTFRTLKNDIEGLSAYTPEGYANIKRGEFGRFESTRFVEQSFIPKGGAADSTTHDPYTGTADAWNNAATGSDWAFFLGEDPLVEAVVVPEEVRAEQPRDLGRSMDIGWYYLGGFALTRTAAADATVVKWDSAV